MPYGPVQAPYVNSTHSCAVRSYVFLLLLVSIFHHSFVLRAAFALYLFAPSTLLFCASDERAVCAHCTFLRYRIDDATVSFPRIPFIRRAKFFLPVGRRFPRVFERRVPAFRTGNPVFWSVTRLVTPGTMFDQGLPSWILYSRSFRAYN